MKKKSVTAGVEALFFASALVSVVSVVFIIVFIFKEGLPLFKVTSVWRFISSSLWKPTGTPPEYGILSFIAGSLWITAGALVFSVPIGISCGIFMAEIANKTHTRILRSIIELLAGIPSVIYGLFGYMAIAPLIRKMFSNPALKPYGLFSATGLGVLTASIVLAIMILPTIINITEVSLKAVPQDLKAASLALGATRWITIYRVVLPAARSGITAGVILGIGRAVGETMAVMMVAGNAVIMPNGLLSLARTLTMNIATDMAYASDYHYTALFTTGIVLFVFILMVNGSVQYILKKSVGENM